MRKNSIYRSPLFSLSLIPKTEQVTIRIQFHTPFVSTRHLPHTFDFLKSYAPHVLLTQCFNEKNLPFDQEVTSTELGHLFEHVLLYYMCILKVEDGCASAVYNGRTDWNWQRDKIGVFHISIDAQFEDSKILTQALQKTIKLTQNLFNYSSQHAYLTT